MESGVVIELQYDTPLWGLQAPLIPQAPGFSIPFGNRSTLCDNERQFSKPRLRKASSRSLGSAHARCHPCVGKWIPITGLRPALWSSALVLAF
jgi:hypothetical protein